MNGTDPTPDPLDALARRVADDRFFLSAAITAYQDRHRLDDAGLALLLDCTPAVLRSLRLCRMPGAGDGRTVEQDIGDICRRFGTDPHILARLVSEATGR